MSCESTRNFQRSTLLDIQKINDEIFSMAVSWSGPAPQAGQFFMIRPERSAVFLGRPISVWSREKNSGTVHFLIALRGQGTREMAAMQKGDGLELSGPLGNCWPLFTLDRDAETAFPKSANPDRIPAALIGGGIGVAPLVFLAEGLNENDFDFYAGFRSTPYGLEKVRARTTVIATEDGCAGSRGRIPDLLEAGKYQTVYACGPEAMLQAVARACTASGTRCYLSLERRMACGVGACLGCTVETKNGNRRCCVDGPVFDAAELLYD